MRLPVLPVLALLALAGTPAYAQTQPPGTVATVEEQEIRQLMKEFETAWQSGDAAALARLWAEESDLGLLGSAPRTRGRAQHERGFADSFARRTGQISRYMEIAAIRFVLPDVAIVDGAFRYGPSQASGGEAMPPRREPFVAVIVRQEGRWAFASGRSGPIVAVSPER